MIVDGQLAAMVRTATTWVLPVIFAVTFHEAAHGIVANQLGDDTALRAGRVSLNPLKHIDPVGTILLPAMMILARVPFLFGYAKPVPVNFGRLKPPRLGMILVALAGPVTNVLLAIISALLAYGVVPLRSTKWGVVGAQSGQLAADQCRSVRFQLAPVTAVGWRPRRGRAATAPIGATAGAP